MVIYIPTLQSKYSVIIACDPILHEYYITGSYKNMNYKRFTWYDTSRCSQVGKESQELNQGNESEGSTTRSPSLRQVSILRLATLLLSTPISNRDSPMSNSRIWTCKSRVIRMQPNEYIRMPSGVRKSKYTLQKINRITWKHVYVCMKLCLNHINESTCNSSVVYV